MAFASLAGLILFTEFRRITQKFTAIGPSAAINILNNDNPVLIDVREQSELNEGVIKDSIHIPLSAINTKVSDLDAYKGRPMMVYCRSGNRSGSVCRTLTSRGFDNVYNLSGGIMAWKDAHLPVVTPKANRKKK